MSCRCNARTILCALTLLMATPAVAVAQDGPWSAGLGLTTLGPGAEVAYRFSPDLAIRGVVAGGLTEDGSETIDGLDVDYDADLFGFGLLLDYYIAQTGFRISGGFVNPSFDVDLSAEVGGDPVEIGGTEYTNVSVDGEASFEQEIAPTLAVGYRYDFAERWYVSAGIGAIFISGIDVDVQETTDGGDVIDPADIDELVSDIEDDLDIGIYPHVSIMVGTRF